MDRNLHSDRKDMMEHHYLPMTSVRSGTGEEVLPDLYCYTNQIVNLCFVGTAKDWVLVDTGMPESKDRILNEIRERFGAQSQPKAIVLTHGHFDHVGAAADLVQHWGVPVYAHPAELPFLTGQTSYPEPDGSVEGGLIAKISPIFPNTPIDLGNHVEAIPDDGSIPDMPDWRWIHTPGHSPGHISLFRDEDRALIAGDAFVTVRQESLYRVITQTKELNGPPRYFTTDWDAAKESVLKLEALKPSVAVTGHGYPMHGEELSAGLQRLAREFDRIAIPDYGRYVKH